MFELLSLLMIGLLGGSSDDGGSVYSGSSSSRNKSSSRSHSKYSVYDHDMDCDGYCYECDDYHDF